MGTLNYFLILTLSCLIFSEQIYCRPELKDDDEKLKEEFAEHLKDQLKENEEAREEAIKNLEKAPPLIETKANTSQDTVLLIKSKEETSEDSSAPKLDVPDLVLGPLFPPPSSEEKTPLIIDSSEEIHKDIDSSPIFIDFGPLIPPSSEERPISVSKEESGDIDISGSGSGDCDDEDCGFGSGSGDYEVMPGCDDDEDCNGDIVIDYFLKSSEDEEPLKTMCTQTDPYHYPWWQVDLQDTYNVDKVIIYNRAQNFHYRLHDIAIRVGMEEISSPFKEFTYNELCAEKQGEFPPGQSIIACDKSVSGRYVTIQITKNYYNVLTLCEVEVYGSGGNLSSTQNLALNKPATQSGEDWGGKADRANDGVVAAQFFAGEGHMSCFNSEDDDIHIPRARPAKLNDCADVYLHGDTDTGVYTIQPKSWAHSEPMQVFCDMSKDGGGWTSILRRHYYIDHSESFHRFYNDYVEGFGDLCEEFWIGNEKLLALTTQNSVQLKIDVYDSYGNELSAFYEKFFILDKEHEYQMHVHGYSGNAGDFLKSGTKFSMKDKEGGWWWSTFTEDGHEFLGCNPNGELWYGQNLSEPITWGCPECHADQPNYYIQFLDMKIRPDWFQTQKQSKWLHDRRISYFPQY